MTPDYRPGGYETIELVSPPQTGSTVEVLGTGPEAAAAVVDVLETLGLT